VALVRWHPRGAAGFSLLRVRGVRQGARAGSVPFNMPAATGTARPERSFTAQADQISDEMGGDPCNKLY
jgi:hypothetical protein